jgi:nitrate reductase gamma subunit
MHYRCTSNGLTGVPKNISEHVRILDLRENGISLEKLSFAGYAYLGELHLSSNNLTALPLGMFESSKNLYHLDLSNQRIKRLEKLMFAGLENLRVLNLSHNKIDIIEGDAFSTMPSLQELYLHGNPMRSFTNQIFQGLNKLSYLKTDKYKFCCFAESVDPDKCYPQADEFSSCANLMRTTVLRFFMWILGGLALVGNSMVIIVRASFKSLFTSSNATLASSLALSDLLMGIYMFIIATADVIFRDNYVANADWWKASDVCRLAGSLATISMEVSLFALVVMTMDRFLAVVFPFSSLRMSKKSSRYAVGTCWIAGIIIAALPLLPINYFAGSYYARSGVCLPLHLTRASWPGWEYSVAIFFGLNLIGVLIIGILYPLMYLTVRQTSRKAGKKTDREFAIARKMALIVVTDFLCWMPSILLGRLLFYGTQCTVNP